MTLKNTTCKKRQIAQLRLEQGQSTLATFSNHLAHQCYLNVKQNRVQNAKIFCLSLRHFRTSFIKSISPGTQERTLGAKLMCLRTAQQIELIVIAPISDSFLASMEAPHQDMKQLCPSFRPDNCTVSSTLEIWNSSTTNDG